MNRYPTIHFVIDGRLTVFTDGSVPDGFKRIMSPPWVIDTGRGEPGTRLATEEDMKPREEEP